MCLYWISPPIKRHCKFSYLWSFCFSGKEFYNLLCGSRSYIKLLKPWEESKGKMCEGPFLTGFTYSFCSQFSTFFPICVYSLQHLEPLHFKDNQAPIPCRDGNGIFSWPHMEDKEIGKGMGGGIWLLRTDVQPQLLSPEVPDLSWVLWGKLICFLPLPSLSVGTKISVPLSIFIHASLFCFFFFWNFIYLYKKCWFMLIDVNFKW